MLHKQLNTINSQVEDLGKVCDIKKQKSYEEYKEKLNSQRKIINNNLKATINELRNKIKEYKDKMNFDYKGRYKEVTDDLTKLIHEMDKDYQNFLMTVLIREMVF
jgi:excinuclease UvrABC nuclease subunit